MLWGLEMPGKRAAPIVLESNTVGGPGVRHHQYTFQWWRHDFWTINKYSFPSNTSTLAVLRPTFSGRTSAPPRHGGGGAGGRGGRRSAQRSAPGREGGGETNLWLLCLCLSLWLFVIIVNNHNYCNCKIRQSDAMWLRFGCQLEIEVYIHDFWNVVWGRW